MAKSGTAKSSLFGGEFALIEQLLAAGSGLKSIAVQGPGDDCAVIALDQWLFPAAENSSNSQQQLRRWLLISTDCYVEQRHFSLNYSSAEDIGWKCLAASLSDIAAMGGKAAGVVIALKARADLSATELERVYRGIYSAAERYSVDVLGGDTVCAEEFALTFTVFGISELPPLLRCGAMPGDDLWVSGVIGGAGSGLRLLEQQINESELSPEQLSCLQRHRRPEARLSLGGELLGSGIAHAAIDISDGLLQDAAHLAKRSGVRLELTLAEIPLANNGITTAEALTAGDDYELLFSAPQDRREQLERLSANEGLTRIGQVLPAIELSAKELAIKQSAQVPLSLTPDLSLLELALPTGEVIDSVEFLRRAGLDCAGYDHFAAKR